MGNPYPLLVAVFPDLTAEIVRLLQAEDEQLAAQITELRYYGRCTCTPTCTNQLTAPVGSLGSTMVQLERDGVDVMWLSLDPSGTTIADIEVLDGRDLS